VPGEREPARPLRAGDSDRSAVVDLLRAHHLDGRLTVDEFEERVGQAHRAVTLLYQREDELIVEIEPGSHGGTELIAHGVGPLNVRRAFASLRD
jgi:hypothetical protein